jgi:hypothetical protein
VALVTVLLALAVLLGLGLAGLSLALTYRELSNTELRSLQAFYAAEAGLAAALAALGADWSWSGYPGDDLPPEAALLEGEGARIREIKVEDLGDMLQIEAQGEAGGRTRRVAAWVQRPAWAYGLVLGAQEAVGFTGNTFLRGTLVFAGDVEIGPSVQVGDSEARDGWIISGGNVTNKGRIYGGVRAVGEIKTLNPGVIEGTVQENAPPFLPGFSAPDMTAYRDRAAQVIRGDLAWGQDELQAFIDAHTPDGAVLFVEGKLTLGSEGNKESHGNKAIAYSGRAVLVATNGIEIAADIVRAEGAEATSALALIAGGDIEVGNHEVQAVLWTGSNLKVHSQTKIVGAVAAWNLDRQGEADPMFELSYDGQLVGLFLGPGSPLLSSAVAPRIVRWWTKDL